MKSFLKVKKFSVKRFILVLRQENKSSVFKLKYLYGDLEFVSQIAGRDSATNVG